MGATTWSPGSCSEFPNVSVIDLSAIMAQFQRITDQVSRAVRVRLPLRHRRGARGALRRDHRPRRTSASSKARSCARWARAAGSSRSMQLAEFLTIGLLAGTIASAGAVAAGDGPLRPRAGRPLRVPLAAAIDRHLRRRLRRRDRGLDRHAPRRGLTAAPDHPCRDLTLRFH